MLTIRMMTWERRLIFLAFGLLIPLTLSVPKTEAATVQSIRGPVEINDGDTVVGFSQFTGTIDGINDVTFVRCNLARTVPHTVVFTNSTNLTFVKCNLKNVELQDDFTYSKSLTIHSKVEDIQGVKTETLERGDGITDTIEYTDQIIDLIEEEYGVLDPTSKAKVEAAWIAQGKATTAILETQSINSTKATPGNKQIKGTKIPSTDTRYDALLKSLGLM